MTVFLVVLVIVMLVSGVLFYMWKLSKWLVLPIQLILFSLLIIVVFRVFVNQKNIENLHDEIANAGISDLETQVMDLAASTVTDMTVKSEQQPEEGMQTKTEQELSPEPKAEPAPKESVKRDVDKSFLNHDTKQQQSTDLIDML